MHSGSYWINFVFNFILYIVINKDWNGTFIASPSSNITSYWWYSLRSRISGYWAPECFAECANNARPNSSLSRPHLKIVCVCLQPATLRNEETFSPQDKEQVWFHCYKSNEASSSVPWLWDKPIRCTGTIWHPLSGPMGIGAWGLGNSDQYKHLVACCAVSNKVLCLWPRSFMFSTSIRKIIVD